MERLREKRRLQEAELGLKPDADTEENSTSLQDNTVKPEEEFCKRRSVCPLRAMFTD